MNKALLLIAALVALCSAATSPRPAIAESHSYHDPSATGERFRTPLPGRTVEDSIIGSDERVPIDDTTVFPFSAIAYLELEDEFGSVFGSCTGTFIGPDTLLTAGHCLWDADFDDWGAEHIRVVPGKDGDYEPFGWQYASDWWVPDEYTVSGSADWDWGVIKLPNDLLSLDTGWLSVTIADTAVLEDPEFYPAIVGYPGDKPDGTMWGLIRPAFELVEDFTLWYDIDTAPGQSGSAIWSASDGPYLGLIVGIHTQGGFLNSGSRIDQELLDDLLTACEVMECSIDVVEAPAGVEIPVPPDLPYRSYGVAVARD